MDFKLFYAWQSDSPLDDNKHLIRDAAKDAVKRIGKDADVEESPRLDHDTKNLSGTPEVANAIFAKIDRAGMFLGDVTFVGASKAADGREKKLPSLNVATELGYAGKAIGWERVILVMNTAYGKPDEQIFDIKHRRNPICYELPPGSSTEKRKEEMARLSKAIEEAVRVRLKCEHEGVREIISILDQHCLQVMVTYAQADSFPGPAITNMGQALAAQAMLHALARMLELRLLRCDVNYDPRTSTGQYAYHWTFLGRQAARQLGILGLD
jgi:hypothetical protein